MHMNYQHELQSSAFTSQQPGDSLQWRIRVIVSPKSPTVTIKVALLRGSSSEVTAKICCDILGVGGTSAWSTSGGRFCQYTVGGEQDLGVIHLSHFSVSNSKYLSNGNLTIYLKIEVHRTDQPQIRTGKKLTIPPGISDKDELTHDFGSLLKDGFLSNVTIVAGGKEFKAHKAILSARSPVFRAMFEHDMREAVQNQVTIEDLSPEVVQEVLTFVYTGQSPNLKGMSADLLRAADKYDLKQLKAWSERELADRLTPGNFVETLLLADQHSAMELKSVCMERFTIHAEEVVKTEGWSNLLAHGQHHLQLVSELIVRSAKK